jgi:type II secretory pathway predicted ATPase ExeA
MYCQFYGFREKPFSLLPDPEFLFLSQKHEKALNLLELGVLNQSGFCIISGEIGAGKTTLVRALLSRLDEHVRAGLISNTHSSYSDLLGWILAAYGLESKSSAAVFQHRRFTDFVIEQYASGKHTLLIIDEAQNLSLSALEQLRMLSNINSDKDLVLQIILIGQSELREKLQQPELEQFAQRIAIDYHLAALDQEETTAYIRHRVVKSGGSQQLFNDAACKLVFERSGGIPRLINRICDLSLVYGFSGTKKVIDSDLIKAVIENQNIDQPVKTPAETVTDNRPPVVLSKPEALSENVHAKRKVTPEPRQKRISQSDSTLKKSDGKQNSAKPIGKTAELKPVEKSTVEKAVEPIKKRTVATLKHGENSSIYAAADKAAIEKTQADFLASEKSSVANALAEKARADAAFAEKAAAEKLAAEKAATEKAAAERAAAALAEASVEAAKLADSEKIAADKTSEKVTLAAAQASELVDQKRKSTEKLVAEKTQIEKTALQEAEAAKSEAEKTLAARIAAEKAAAESAAAADNVARKATANRAAAEKAAASMVSDSEAAAKRALARETEAARIVTEKTAANKAAIEKAGLDTELAKKAATEMAAADSDFREKSVAARQAAQMAAASRAAAEKALDEKKTADTIAKEKASLEKVALAKIAASVASTAQQAADKAAAARNAAQKEASEKEAAALMAARKAAEASALAEKVAAESRTLTDAADLFPDKNPDLDSPSVNRHPSADTQPPVPAIQDNIPRTPSRRARAIVALSIVSAVVAASTWLMNKPDVLNVLANLPVVDGQSFTNPGPMTEAAALEPVAHESGFQQQP